MIKSINRYLAIFGVVIVAGVVLAWLSSPDPKLNHASFEKTALIEGIAPLDEAITLAQFIDENGQTVTVQVVDFAGEKTTTCSADCGPTILSAARICWCIGRTLGSLNATQFI